MRVLAYEYLSTGALAGRPGADSLAAEGLAMLAAVLEDLAGCPGVHPVTVVAAGLVGRVAGCEVHVAEPDEEGQFRRLARMADWSLIIAPEFDDLLAARSQWAVEEGSCLLGSPAGAGPLLAASALVPGRPDPAEGVAVTRLPDGSEEWAVEHSRLTHRDPIALAACAAMAVGVAACVRRESPDATLQQMIAAARRHSPDTAAMMRQARDEARAGVLPDVTLDRLRGWAAHEAIAAAVYIFARHPDDARVEERAVGLVGNVIPLMGNLCDQLTDQLGKVIDQVRHLPNYQINWAAVREVMRDLLKEFQKLRRITGKCLPLVNNEEQRRIVRDLADHIDRKMEACRSMGA